jgi:hypothetical protein
VSTTATIHRAAGFVPATVTTTGRTALVLHLQQSQTNSTALLTTLLMLKWCRTLPATSTQTTKHAGGVERYVCVRRKHGCSEGFVLGTVTTTGCTALV